ASEAAVGTRPEPGVVAVLPLLLHSDCHVCTEWQAVATQRKGLRTKIEGREGVLYSMEATRQPVGRNAREPGEDPTSEHSRVRPALKRLTVRGEPVARDERVVVGPEDVLAPRLPHGAVARVRLAGGPLEEVAQRESTVVGGGYAGSVVRRVVVDDEEFPRRARRHQQ